MHVLTFGEEWMSVRHPIDQMIHVLLRRWAYAQRCGSAAYAHAHYEVTARAALLGRKHPLNDRLGITSLPGFPIAIRPEPPGSQFVVIKSGDRGSIAKDVSNHCSVTKLQHLHQILTPSSRINLYNDTTELCFEEDRHT